MSTSNSLSSNLLTSFINPVRRFRASEYSLLSIKREASLASTRCRRNVRFSARVHSTISLQREICKSQVPGILATASMIPLTIFAVFALGIKEKKGLSCVRRLLSSSAFFSSVSRSESFEIACSLMRKASEEDEGSSRMWYRREMDSVGFTASKACANESVLAGRNDDCIGDAISPFNDNNCNNKKKVTKSNSFQYKILK
ncbi:hypothetical protein M5K25_013264 [Dendrobium thyrsiflorum]|uniref:Uncharacterized protein n=1 Tax=Dendrobium thyrsiflorum TaxID=117978 RepID=A0ABD0UZX7_DENTH